jgi:urea-proton symporter
MFGLVLKFGNLALVLMDTAFWQKSFASEVHSTVPAYDLVSIVIIAIPWCTGTIIGLSARAVEKTPIWFDYPNTLTLKQVNSGLVMPYVLRSLLGRGATAGLLVLIFMAITSTVRQYCYSTKSTVSDKILQVSSSMIAVSSIISQDFFRTYIDPRASDRKTLKVSHWGVVFHGCFMAGFAIMLQYAGATNNWSTYFRPIVACPGILPLILTLLWSRQTQLAAILAPFLGLISGLTVWLSLSWKWSGIINIQSTQDQVPGLYAAIVSFFSPAVYSVIISLLWPSRFDWREFLRIDLIGDKTQPSSSLQSNLPSDENVDHTAEPDRDPEKEASHRAKEQSSPVLSDEVSSSLSPIENQTRNPLDDIVHPFDESTLRHIRKWFRYASIYFVINVLVTIVLWPLPLYRNYVFTRTFFTGWVVMAIIWHFGAMFAVIIYPLWDGRHDIIVGVKGAWKDLRIFASRAHSK